MLYAGALHVPQRGAGAHWVYLSELMVSATGVVAAEDYLIW